MICLTAGLVAVLLLYLLQVYMKANFSYILKHFSFSGN